MKQLEPTKGPEDGHRCTVCGAIGTKGMIFFQCEDDQIQVVDPEEPGAQRTAVSTPCAAKTCDAAGCRAHHDAEHEKQRETAKALVPPHLQGAPGV